MGRCRWFNKFVVDLKAEPRIIVESSVFQKPIGANNGLCLSGFPEMNLHFFGIVERNNTSDFLSLLTGILLLEKLHFESKSLIITWSKSNISYILVFVPICRINPQFVICTLFYVMIHSFAAFLSWWLTASSFVLNSGFNKDHIKIV